MKEGKITSAKRSLETLQQKTVEFIDLINRLKGKNTLNKNNILVFDETVIGGGARVPLVIGERRASAGGSINAVIVCERTLGCYIPFSMPDGSKYTLLCFHFQK